MKIFFFFFLVAFFAFAQQSPQYGQEAEFDMSALSEAMDGAAIDDPAQDFAFAGGNQENLGIILLRIAGSLALVLLIVAAVAWGVRKSGIFGKSVASAVAGQTPSMAVLEVLSTGFGGAVLLLRCEDKVFLLGQSQSNYTLLNELDEETAKKVISNKLGSDSLSNFKSSLTNFMQNVKVQRVGANPEHAV
jgi:flagellar biogenesis protein FliO